MHTPAGRPAPPRTGRVSREQRASGAQPSTRAGKSLSHSGRPITDSVRSVCASIDRSVAFWRADPKSRVDARTLRRAPAREPRIRWSPGGRARARARPRVRPPAGTCAIGNVWPPSARPETKSSVPARARVAPAHAARMRRAHQTPGCALRNPPAPRMARPRCGGRGMGAGPACAPARACPAWRTAQQHFRTDGCRVWPVDQHQQLPV